MLSYDTMKRKQSNSNIEGLRDCVLPFIFIYLVNMEAKV